jgi:PPOX class probable F420-dependent enzyme
VSRRDQITMSADEIAAFLDEQKTVIAATNGVNGWPHLMPLWFIRDGEELWAWTFAKSQKVKNLERDPRATLQVEDGVEYQLLRGVMIEADVVIHRDIDRITDFGVRLMSRYAGDGGSSDAMAEIVRAQAPKRVALQFKPVRTASFDHRKLGGVY